MDTPHADKAGTPNRAARRHPATAVAEQLATTHPLAGKLLVPAKEAQEILGLSRSMIYHLMEAGELQTVSFGRRRMIVVESLTDLVSRRIAEAA